MIYYHFADKLALYRAVVADGSRGWARRRVIASVGRQACRKLDRFIEAFVRMTETRPWIPPLMLREIAEGAPRSTPTRWRTCAGDHQLRRILKQGQETGVFRKVIRSSPTTR